MSTAAAHAHPTRHPIDQSPNLPQRVPGWPSGVAAERARSIEDSFGHRRTKDPMAVGQHAFVHR
jgi:hypothetical protein